MKQLFIFDVDGTLVNSKAGLVCALSETFKQVFNVTVPQNELYQFAGSQFNFLVSEFVGTCSAELHKKAEKFFSDLYYGKYSKHLGMFEGVSEVLPQLQSKVYLATATNMSQNGVENLFAVLGIDHLFNKIVGTDRFSSAKPNPDILYKSMDELGVSKENTIMFGDTPTDIHAGKNAGVKTVALVYGKHIPSMIETAKPDYIFQSFHDVLTLVNER